MAGSGYQVTPHLVRRGDGQILQVTPLLAAIVEAIDGDRDLDAIADQVERTHGRPVHPDDIGQLIDAKLRPLGLLVRSDGSDPVVRRANPLLGLRGRVVLTSARRTRQLTGPFLWLFRPAVVGGVLVAFAAVSAWALLHHGLGPAVDDAMADPALLLLLIALILASGAFHEVGHATACRYGGADPGVMGAAVYLVWPAFYTDVTDSYRLSRAGRLRVDLGGLYFNAVFTVLTGAAWAITGQEALLILVPVQLLQMVRQLLPIVRFDGYHILADLVGVPDLFNRIRPTLARAIPWRRDATPNPLKPWAQAVVVAWVVLVVPVLVVSFGLLAWNLPAIVTGSLQALDAQSQLLANNVDAGRVAASLLGLVAMATVAFVPLSALYLTVRLARRSGARFWRVTEGRPMLRSATLAVLAVGLLAAGPGLLPSIPDEGTGDLAGAGQQLLDGEVVELAAAGPARPTALPMPEPDDVDPLDADGQLRTTSETGFGEQWWMPTASAGTTAQVAPADTDPAPAEGEVRDPWPFGFDRPAAPGAGDNQALAVNTVDDTGRFAMDTSIDWESDGSMHNANEAYALASCRRCATVAVAFQIVAATTPTASAVPRNVAVAHNLDCEACRTTAVAVQLAVTLDEEPSPTAKAQLRRIVADLEARRGAYRTAAPDVIRAELLAAKAAALEVLAPWLLEVEDTDDGTAVADETDEADGTEEGDPEVGGDPGAETNEEPLAAEGDTTIEDTGNTSESADTPEGDPAASETDATDGTDGTAGSDGTTADTSDGTTTSTTGSGEGSTSTETADDGSVTSDGYETDGTGQTTA
jgi:putative peptide zinc metalloprotease protein